jgi:hypothetical protein
MNHPSELPMTSGNFRHIRRHVEYLPGDGCTEVACEGWAVYAGRTLIGTTFTEEEAVQMLSFTTSPVPPSPCHRGSMARGGEPSEHDKPAAPSPVPPGMYDSPFGAMAITLGVMVACWALFVWWVL